MHLLPNQRIAEMPAADSDYHKAIIKWLTAESTNEDRIYFFSPQAIWDLDDYNDFEKMEEWVYRFHLWRKMYHTPTLYAKRANFQILWTQWIYEILFKTDPQQSKTYNVSTGRQFLKTLDVKGAILYCGTYAGSLDEVYHWYLTDSDVKLKEDIEGIRNDARSELFMADYGEVIGRATTNSLTFVNNDYKVEGMTIKAPRTGITHHNIKATVLWLDEPETSLSLLSLTETGKNYHAYRETITHSLNQHRRRIFHTNNYLDSFGNVAKFIKEAGDNAMVIGLYEDAENEKGLTWIERYVETDEELKIPGNEHKISVETLKREAEKKEDGLEGFMRHMLCHPDTAASLYHDIVKIHGHCEPIDPIEVWVDPETELEYFIYKKFDSSKRYTLGVDLSDGVEIDSHAWGLAEVGAHKATIMVDCAINNITQSQFAESNLRFFDYFGARPFITPEMPRGNEYINTLRRLGYPDHLIYSTDENEDLAHENQHDVKVKAKQKQYGFFMTGINANRVSSDIKKQLENGEVINLSRNIDRELKHLKKLQSVEINKRVSSNLAALLGVTQHFDRISAIRMLGQGIAVLPKIQKVAEREKFTNTQAYRKLKSTDQLAGSAI